MKKIIKATLAVTAASASLLAVSAQSTLAATVISNIGIPAPADGSLAPAAGGTTTIDNEMLGQAKAFGFTVPANGPDYTFESATFWLIGYDGDDANPPEAPVATIHVGTPTGQSVGSITPNITDPINNPPGTNDPAYFEFTGATPTLTAGTTYYITLTNDSSSAFNWARDLNNGATPTDNPFEFVDYQFSDANTSTFSFSSELSGIAIEATPHTIPEPMTILGSLVVLGFGGAMKRKAKK